MADISVINNNHGFSQKNNKCSLNMKLEYYFYKCKDCDTKFKSPNLGGDRYGEFLMRSELSDIVYLSAINNKVFSEVSKIFDQNSLIINRQVNNIAKAKIFHKIFGVACDKAPDSTPYETSRNPICPYCGNNNTDIWGEINPPEFIELDIKPVTHNDWNKLSQAEKILLVDQAIKKLI